MTNVVQTTLAQPVSYSGIGLHAANEVHMVLRPAPADTGIVFVRTDLADRPSVPAQLAYVTNTMRATTLERGEAKVFTVEHLLSALQGMAVDNCIVEMDSVEPPVAAGSISCRKKINSLPFFPMTDSALPLLLSILIRCWEYSSAIQKLPRKTISAI